MARKKKQTLLQQSLHHLWDHVWPHSRNHHVPHVLHHRALFGLSTVLVGLKGLVILTSLTLPTHSLWSSAITPENIITLTNQTRNALELPQLRTDDKLMAAAQAKAEDMLEKGYFAHTSPAGITPWYWFKTYDYDYRSAGENLAAHFVEAEDVQAGWMASPKHRDNIVSERFDEIGVGVAQGTYEGYPTTFVVQMFGYEFGDTHEPLATDTSPQTTAAPSNDGLSVDLSSLIVSPSDNAYRIEIQLTHVREATVQLGEHTAALSPTSDPTIWAGTISYRSEDIAATGEQMTLTAKGWYGDAETHDLAWIMPNGYTQLVYAFGDEKMTNPKLLGVFDIAGLNDGVQKFFISVIAVLGSILLLALVVKRGVKRPTMVAGTLAVIGLACLLTIL